METPLEAQSHSPTRWLLLIGFVLAAILEVLDTSIINPVLPTMAGNLGSTTEEIGWVSTAYILSNVVFLPLTAWLSRRFGLKRYVLASIVLFISSSVMCGFVHSLNEMILWRLVQGAAGAPLISMTQTAIAEVFPKHEQNMAQGMWALGICVAPSVAPALGGWIADNYNWPWIFFINVPLGIIAILMIGPLFIEQPREPAGRADWLGIGLLTVGLASLQYVLEEGSRKDWFNSDLIVKLTFAAVVGCFGFIWWQLSSWNKAPIFDLRVMKDRSLTAGTILCLVAGFSLYSGIYVFPIFGQAVLGFTATKSGTFMLIPGVTLAFGMIAGATLMQKGVPARDLVFIGTFLSIAAMWILGHMTPMSNESDAQLGLDFRSIGLALLLLPIISAALATLKGSAIGQGAAVTGLARQLGGSVGIAVTSTYVTHMTATHRYDLATRFFDGSPMADERRNLLAGNYFAHGFDMERATAAANKIIDGQLTGQAYTMAVNNAYILVGVLFVVTMPCIFLMRRAASTEPVSAH